MQHLESKVILRSIKLSWVPFLSSPVSAAPGLGSSASQAAPTNERYNLLRPTRNEGGQTQLHPSIWCDALQDHAKQPMSRLQLHLSMGLMVFNLASCGVQGEN